MGYGVRKSEISSVIFSGQMHLKSSEIASGDSSQRFLFQNYFSGVVIALVDVECGPNLLKFQRNILYYYDGHSNG